MVLKPLKVDTSIYHDTKPSMAKVYCTWLSHVEWLFVTVDGSISSSLVYDCSFHVGSKRLSTNVGLAHGKMWWKFKKKI